MAQINNHLLCSFLDSLNVLGIVDGFVDALLLNASTNLMINLDVTIVACSDVVAHPLG